MASTGAGADPVAAAPGPARHTEPGAVQIFSCQRAQDAANHAPRRTQARTTRTRPAGYPCVFCSVSRRRPCRGVMCSALRTRHGGARWGTATGLTECSTCSSRLHFPRHILDRLFSSHQPSVNVLPSEPPQPAIPDLVAAKPSDTSLTQDGGFRYQRPPCRTRYVEPRRAGIWVRHLDRSHRIPASAVSVVYSRTRCPGVSR